MVAQVALALVEGTVGEATAVVDPEARLSLQALEQVLQQENGPWTTAGSPSRFGRYFAVPLEGGGDPFTLIAAVVAAADGHLVLQAATLTR